MSAHINILRSIPNFPNYTFPTFGYPERIVRSSANSIIVLGPPIHLYNYSPPTRCSVHVSGIPDWATMGDVAEVMEQFGKIFTIELSVSLASKVIGPPRNNGWAFVTFVTYDSAQRALSSNLSVRIQGMVKSLSIYKGIVSNVVLLKNLPTTLSKAEILSRITTYPGVFSVSFIKDTTARMVFLDRDLALLFMDLVSSGGLKMNGFTCAVQAEDREDDDDSDY